MLTQPHNHSHTHTLTQSLAHTLRRTLTPTHTHAHTLTHMEAEVFGFKAVWRLTITPFIRPFPEALMPTAQGPSC